MNKQKQTRNKTSLTKTVNSMFSAMKFAKKIGMEQCTKFFVYDLACPIFDDFTPLFYVSDVVKKNPYFSEVLKLPVYSKGKVYKILNNDTMKVHEEHMTPNGQLQNMLLKFDKPKDFEDFIRNNYAIAIITKEENAKLDKAKLRSKRANLEEAFAAYKQVGIKIKKINFGKTR
jgi:hypothetical protein